MKVTTIKPGAVWNDTEGNPIQAHGGGILTMYENGQAVYYWYGEDRRYGRHPLVGVRVYKSYDLLNWENSGVCFRAINYMNEFESVPYFKELYKDVPIETKNELYKDLYMNTTVMERPKVIYNAKNNNYVLWFHADGTTAQSVHLYAKAKAAVAISDSPLGPFKLLGSYKLDHYGGESGFDDPGMARDMTLFQDGTDAYIAYTSEHNATLYISKLNDDYTMVQSGGVGSAKYNPKPGIDYVRIFADEYREAPALMRYQDSYYIITSGCTGWEPNAAMYAKAKDVLGEWTIVGSPCIGDESNTTFDSQSTFALPLNEENGKYLYLGDRWNAENLSDSRYIWLPLDFTNDGKIEITWADEWMLT